MKWVSLVRIEECIDIEFEYSSSYYHMNDSVIEKFKFLEMKLKIKNI